MEPVHTVEYELTSALATDIQRKLLRWEIRRGWRRDLHLYVGTFVFAALIVGLGWKDGSSPVLAAGSFVS